MARARSPWWTPRFRVIATATRRARQGPHRTTCALAELRTGVPHFRTGGAHGNGCS